MGSASGSSEARLLPQVVLQIVVVLLLDPEPAAVPHLKAIGQRHAAAEPAAVVSAVYRAALDELCVVCVCKQRGEQMRVPQVVDCWHMLGQ